MALTELDRNVRTQNLRYKAHLRRGDGLFAGRLSQQEIRNGLGEYFQETDPETGKPYTAGYFVAPPRLGKTIIMGDYIIGINTTPKGEYVLNDSARRKRVLICAPTNQLVEQWSDRLLGKKKEDGTREPSLFGDRFTEENVGVYNAKMSQAQKMEVLKKPVIIMTDDSVRNLAQNEEEDGIPVVIKGENLDTVIIDETDARVRGDAHRKVFQDAFFDKCKIIGMTATDLYRSGKTIGDYLYDGKKPIAMITQQEAIDRKEIAPNTTITYESEVDWVKAGLTVEDYNHWDTLSDVEKERFIKQTGSDTAAIEILAKGVHPQTGKKLSEMKQLWKGETIAHSKYFAQMLNERFGEHYAAVVHGGMPEDEITDIMKKYAKGEIKALVQCKLLGRGYDDEDIEFTGQLAPSQSPNDLIQFYTRADTRKGNKIAVHLTPRFPGINHLNIGELLGGQIMIPPGWEFDHSDGTTSPEPAEVQPWPDINGFNIYYTTEQTEQLAQKISHERIVGELPRKTDKVFDLAEMAAKLNISPKLLKQRVYDPLEAAYRDSTERDKMVTAQAREEKQLYINGWRIPKRDLGFYQVSGSNGTLAQEQFCISENQLTVCKRALYGQMTHQLARPELLTKQMAAARLSTTAENVDRLWSDLQEKFFEAKSTYTNIIEIGGQEFANKDFGFFMDPAGTPELCITPDALKSAYAYCHPEAAPDAIARWEEQTIKPLKTTEWFTVDDVAKDLALHGNEPQQLRDYLEKITQNRIYGAQIKKLRPGEEMTIPVGTGHNKYDLHIAKKTLPGAPGNKRDQLCFHRDDFAWIEETLGLESREAARSGRRRA